MVTDQTIQVYPGFVLGILDSAGSRDSLDVAIGVAYVRYRKGPWQQILFHALDEEAYSKLLAETRIHEMAIYEAIFFALARRVPDLFKEDVYLDRVEFYAKPSHGMGPKVVRRPKVEELVAHG